MGYIEIIGFVFSGLAITVLVIIQINEIRETKRLKEERKKCVLMISRCSVLLRLLEDSPYMTNLDFHFLRYRIYRNYIRIHEMPFKIPFSEEERLILAEGMHWISTLGES